MTYNFKVVQVPLAQGPTEKAQLTRIGELEGNVVTVRAHVAALHGYVANLMELVASIKVSSPTYPFNSEP